MNREKTKSNANRYGYRIIIVLAIVVFIALAFVYLMKGKTTVTGTYPASIKTGAIVCSKSKAQYPYVDYPESEGSTLGDARIVGTYNEASIIQEIALDFSTYFESKDAAKIGEAVMHGEFGKRLTAEDLPYSEFNNKFSIVDKKVVMSLTASVDDLADNNYYFFLLPNNPKNGISIDKFKQNYANQGYKCVSTNQE